MTNRRAMELLMIEMACVKRASGMEYDLNKQDWIDTGHVCNRDCANCALVQDSKELLDMYGFMISKITEEINEEERIGHQILKDWQRNCDPRQPMEI